ncbi:MAG TPA: hypothetical protein VKQ54_15910 [Caulobacteraceae bacterium]|nr:hypothetical protein [Caulobacteraceae bacterium]
MRPGAGRLGTWAALSLAAAGAAQAAPDPLGRVITDPASIVSAARTPAAPPPIAACSTPAAGWARRGASTGRA